MFSSKVALRRPLEPSGNTSVGKMIHTCPSGSSFGRRSDARSDLDDDPHTALGERHADDEEPHARQDRLRCGLHEPLADLGRGHLARI